QEVACYADVAKLNQGQNAISDLALSLTNSRGTLPLGCNTLLRESASRQLVPKDALWTRVRGMLSKNLVSEARALSQAMGEPLSASLGGTPGSTRASQESALYAISSPAGSRSATAARIQSLANAGLSADQAGFAWGQAAVEQAKQQNMSTAIRFYDNADKAQLDAEQWAWYVRAALRQQDMAKVGSIIKQMPSTIQSDPAWQYWLGRAEAAAGNRSAAETQWRKASASGRNFYATMATEALGNAVSTKGNSGRASSKQIERMAQEPSVHQAIVLFKNALATNSSSTRNDARNEWRYAMRGKSEADLLVASEVALKNEFLEMAIYSAEQTDKLLNYELRYLSPFKTSTIRYANEVGVDPAWVYGLIRQESRFVIGARSHVGASGLMQIMPATAREIAGKIGAGNNISDIDNNIRMGTWYLASVNRQLGHPVLATAGYNAGASRAKRWQASTPLEGAIYAETIPFDETRDYVKKVMSNTVYYASLFNEPGISLTKWMGTIPAKR
ncbi:MAG: lytic transglycosylase domain-containing protein, partial [Neisseriaceae bacterium]|nr:lytic transglycosylase domain-containing protein [Neisseriaceae bacterium]